MANNFFRRVQTGRLCGLDAVRNVIALDFWEDVGGEGQALTKNLTDLLTLSDFFTKEPNLIELDSISLSDSAIKETNKTITDNFNLSDGINTEVIYNREINDNFSINDSIAKNPFKEFSDVLSFEDSQSFEHGLIKEIADTLTLSDNINFKEVAKILFDTISLADELIKNAELLKSDNISFLDENIKGVELNKSDSINLQDYISKNISFALIDFLIFEDLPVISKLLLLTLSDNITLSDSNVFFYLQKNQTIKGKLKRWDGAQWVDVDTLIVFRNI